MWSSLGGPEVLVFLLKCLHPHLAVQKPQLESEEVKKSRPSDHNGEIFVNSKTQPVCMEPLQTS